MAIGRGNIGDRHLPLPQLGDSYCPTSIHTRTRRRFFRRLGLFTSRAVRRVPACFCFLRRPLLQGQEVTVSYRGPPPDLALQLTAGKRRLPAALSRCSVAATELGR